MKQKIATYKLVDETLERQGHYLAAVILTDEVTGAQEFKVLSQAPCQTRDEATNKAAKIIKYGSLIPSDDMPKLEDVMEEEDKMKNVPHIVCKVPLSHFKKVFLEERKTLEKESRKVLGDAFMNAAFQSLEDDLDKAKDSGALDSVMRKWSGWSLKDWIESL